MPICLYSEHVWQTLHITNTKVRLMAKKSAFSTFVALLLDCHSVSSVELFLYFTVQILSASTAAHLKLSSTFLFVSILFPSSQKWLLHYRPIHSCPHAELCICTSSGFTMKHFVPDFLCIFKILRRSPTNPLKAHGQISSLLLLLGWISGLGARLGLAH